MVVVVSSSKTIIELRCRHFVELHYSTWICLFITFFFVLEEGLSIFVPHSSLSFTSFVVSPRVISTLNVTLRNHVQKPLLAYVFQRWRSWHRRFVGEINEILSHNANNDTKYLSEVASFDIFIRKMRIYCWNLLDILLSSISFVMAFATRWHAARRPQKIRSI